MKPTCSAYFSCQFLNKTAGRCRQGILLVTVGSTRSGQADDDLYVFDATRQKRWKSTPAGTAHQKDFHAVDLGNGEDPMAVEKKLAQLEGQWATVVKNVVERKAIPSDESVGNLMVFIGFMAIRVPRIRDVLSDFIGRVSKAQIHLNLATKEGRTGFRNEVEESSKRRLTDEEFEGLVEFVSSGNYDVNFDQTWHVQEMLRLGFQLAPLLSLRHWHVQVAATDAPDLICSDSPVVPVYATPMPGLIPAAFGTPNTIVSIPLNRRIALTSMLEPGLVSGELDSEAVAAMNSTTASHASQLFSPEEDFVWMMKGGKIGNATALLEGLKKAATVSTD